MEDLLDIFAERSFHDVNYITVNNLFNIFLFIFIQIKLNNSSLISNINCLINCININANQETLNIEVESKQTGDSWIANFQAQYIEEIASKTGNYKKYTTFLKMLSSAFNNQTETVYIDILTYSDLEQIKNKRSKQLKTQNLAPNNKRYLILSYIVEFDKIHYPLPLNFNDQPNLQQMKNTIIRLRKENESLQKNLLFYEDSKKMIQILQYY